jgi:hypothetical protein
VSFLIVVILSIQIDFTVGVYNTSTCEAYAKMLSRYYIDNNDMKAFCRLRFDMEIVK